jgi:hypothetical protein
MLTYDQEVHLHRMIAQSDKLGVSPSALEEFMDAAAHLGLCEVRVSAGGNKEYRNFDRDRMNDMFDELFD